MSLRQKTFDELPGLAVRRGELRRSLKLTTIAGIYGVVWLSTTSGSHINTFATMLGCTNWQFGLMGAIPLIGNLGQLLASVQIERSGIRKYQFLAYGVAYKAVWIAMAAIPLLFHLPSRAAVWAMLLIMLAVSLGNSMAAPAWLTWMGYVIPKRIRGRYFANRALYGRPIQMAWAVLQGVALDQVTRHKVAADVSASGEPVLLWVICGLFVLGGIFGVIEVLAYWPIREVLPTGDKPAPRAFQLDHLGAAPSGLGPRIGYGARAGGSFIWQMLIAPLVEDKGFRHYVGFSVTLSFAASLPGMFLWKNAMETLGFNNVATNALFLVIQPVLGLAGAKAWGRMVDRWGHRPALFLATSLMILSLLPWMLVTRHTPAPGWMLAACNWVFRGAGALVGRSDWFALTPAMPVTAFLAAAGGLLFAGMGWTGVGLAQTAINMGFSEGKGRSKYVAASAVLTSLGGALGATVGGLVATWLEYFQTHPLLVGPFEWNNWHATYVLSIVFRVVALFWLIHMPAPGSRPIRDLMPAIAAGIFSTVAGVVLFPLRVFGWGRAEPPRRRG